MSVMNPTRILTRSPRRYPQTVTCRLVGAALLLGACGGPPLNSDSGPPGDGGRTDAGPVVDAGTRDAFVPLDAGDRDASTDGGSDAGPPPPTSECTTVIDPSLGGSFIELCEVEDRARHVRIEGIIAPPFHASAQVVFGFDEPPAGPNVDLADGQLRVLFYGGSTPAPPPLAQATFGAESRALGEPATFLHAPSTVCFDVHEGSESAPPYVILWLDGARGADCEDRATLTLETAYGMELEWSGARGPIATGRVFFRQSSGLTAAPVVTLSREPAVHRDVARAGLSCETAWTPDTEWQRLCTPAAGRARHVRIEDIRTTANNSYFYLVLGEPADPSGNPALGPNKLVVTGGQSSSGASWTWFRFHEGSTGQFRYPSPDSAAPLYTSAPTTICMDLGDHDGNLRVVFWASGANGADCADPETLRLENALYDSTTDEVSGSIWNAPLSTEGLDFVKTNAATVSLGRVVLFREPAVLP